MRTHSVVALILAAVTATRCTTLSGYPTQSGNATADLQALDEYFAPAVLSKYHAKDSQPDEQQRYRDLVINSRLRAVDLHFAEFERFLTRDTAELNIVTDLSVLGLSAAGTLVGSAPTKSILAAISGGITGAKGSIDKNLFYNKAIPALFAQMDSLRLAALVTIRTGMQQNTTDYPLEKALLDIDAYYKAGTIPQALLGITATAGADSSAKTQTLDALFQRDAATGQLRAYWKPDGKTIDPDHEQALRKWLVDHNLDISITFFLHAPQYAAQRQRAVTELIK